MVYLPDTAITTLSIGSNIYTYAQKYEGFLTECRGELQNGKYSYEGQADVLARYSGQAVRAKAPKLFTPLAAAYIGPSTRASSWHIHHLYQSG